MILGADVGSKQTKTNIGVIFDSRVSTKELLYNSNHKIVIDNQTFYIGQGEYETESNKVDRNDFLVYLFAAIGLSSVESMNQVVVGLPIEHYKSQKQKLINLINENRIQDVSIDGGPKRQIIITDVEVAPEGVSAYHTLNNEIKTKIGKQDLVIVDIGGRTTDICEYKLENGKRRISDYKSVMVGMLNIYDDFVKAINAKYALDFNLEDGEFILKNGLFIKGERQDVSFTREILVEHVKKIFQTLYMRFKVDNKQPLLVGGGGVILNGLFRKKLPHIILANEPVFGNAIGFSKVGESLWGTK
jgi:plasmid segregation protein ParM